MSHVATTPEPLEVNRPHIIVLPYVTLGARIFRIPRAMAVREGDP